MKILCCPHCMYRFSLSGKEKTLVSCPTCSRLITVKDHVQEVVRDIIAVSSRDDPPLSPEMLSGRFKCTNCAKNFIFERLPEDKLSTAYCPYCDCVEVVALSPVASVQAGGRKVSKKRIKLVRFIRSNYKTLATAREYLGGLENIILRAALPSETQETLLSDAKGFREKLLSSIEESADKKLDKRMKELGIKDGEGLL